MYLCYLDESGSPENPETNTFVLAGLALPASQWKPCDAQLTALKKAYGLESVEIHTAWMMREYSHEGKISGFEGMDWDTRRAAVQKFRSGVELAFAESGAKKHFKRSLDERKSTEPYWHLTRAERQELIRKLTEKLSGWADMRLIGGAISRRWFMSSGSNLSMFEFAFENLVNRFEAFLMYRAKFLESKARVAEAKECIGLLIEDNNDTVSKRVTELMRKFHRSGTLFRNINRIIETPLFVDSELTSMVQMADIAAYSIRRYLDNNETELFDRIYQRVDKAKETAVGFRHFARGCLCKICLSHGKGPTSLGAVLSGG